MAKIKPKKIIMPVEPSKPLITNAKNVKMDMNLVFENMYLPP